MAMCFAIVGGGTVTVELATCQSSRTGRPLPTPWRCSGAR
jgi:hypothetical protein